VLQDDTDLTKDVTTLCSIALKPDKEGNRMHLRASLVYYDRPGDMIQNFLGLALHYKNDEKSRWFPAYSYDKNNPQLEWNNW
jgi:hypothetical protein